MYAYKIVVTTLVLLLCGILAAFCFSLKGKDKQTATYIGFTVMILIEIMAVVGLWI